MRASAGVGLGMFGLAGAVLGGVLGGLRQSHIAMIIQVVDVRTSRLLLCTTVEGKANDCDIGGALGGFGGGFGGVAGLGTWQKTPVEKAIRIAVIQAVKELSSKTPATYFRHGVETTTFAPVLPTKHSRAGRSGLAGQEISSAPVATAALPSTVKVKVSVANLRDAPAVQGKIIATVKQGAKLSVQAEENGWFLVETDDAKNGWIAKSLTMQ